MISIFQAVEKAIEIANTSSHSKNRIAGTIFHEKEGWFYSCVNFWPEKIEDAFGKDQKIGNSSGTIHAETACIYEAAFKHHQKTEHASIAITDPPCPNCVKNMAEAGIDNIYIDHKGFQKDFAQRRIEYFNTLSIRLAEKAGMSIYEVNRKLETIIPITIANKDYIPKNETPLNIVPIEKDENFLSDRKSDLKTAIAICYSNEQTYKIYSYSHPALGFDSSSDENEIKHPATKYSYIQEACNRLVMNVAKYGYIIKNKAIIVSEIPTSREFVNMVGAGIETVKIENKQQFRDEHSLTAMKQLKENNIIQFSE